jgi:hypothetical protein
VIERKAAGEALGLELNSRRGALLVDAVKAEGVVGQYNASHPATALEPGDEILRVNNVKKGASKGSGDVEPADLVGELKNNLKMELELRRKA